MYLIKLRTGLEFSKFIWANSFSRSNEVRGSKRVNSTQHTFHVSHIPSVCFFFQSRQSRRKRMSHLPLRLFPESPFSPTIHMFSYSPLSPSSSIPKLFLPPVCTVNSRFGSLCAACVLLNRRNFTRNILRQWTFWFW